MRSAAHRVTAAAALPLAMLCAMDGSAAAARRHCTDCELPDIPYGWDDGAGPPPASAPFPQGFVLTVPVTPGRAAHEASATLDRYVEVGAALGHCLSAALSPDDAHWSDLTLRVSFRRDGAINGVPRIAHVSPSPESGAPRTVLAALSHCTPLPFSLALGRAIAGQIFAIRFVQQRNS